LGTTAPRAHSSSAESLARASVVGHGGIHRKPLPVDIWGAVGRVPPTALAQQAPQLQLSSVAESAVAGCGLHESGDRTWQVKAVTLCALPADPCLTVVTAAAAETADASHPRVAPSDSMHSLQYECPSAADPVCLAWRVHGPTPSTSEFSSCLARLPPYPSSCHLPSVKVMIEDYRVVRYE
jgi:hypothetical protein